MPKDCFVQLWMMKACVPVYRAWRSLHSLTSCRSLVALYRGRCVAHLGLINDSAQPEHTEPGRMASQVISDGKAGFLANLARYPGGPACLSMLLMRGRQLHSTRGSLH